MNIFRYMLVFIALAAIAEFMFHDMTMLVFILSAVALVPLAALLGEATEELAIHTGPKIGGLIQATLGNAAELIIAIVALRAGNIFEISMLTLSVLLATTISSGGDSDWLQGSMLLAVWIIAGLGFFFIQ